MTVLTVTVQVIVYSGLLVFLSTMASGERTTAVGSAQSA